MFSVGGRTLRPVSVRGGRPYVCGAGGRRDHPAALPRYRAERSGARVDDSPALGLSVRRIRRAEGAAVMDAALDHPGLGAGWWAMDADSGTGGDQAFTFIGNAAFSASGQVRAEVIGGMTLVSGNVNADLGAVPGDNYLERSASIILSG